MSDLCLAGLYADLERDTASCIATAEEGYRTAVLRVVEEVLLRGDCRVLLLAGPSSSGKTTTARILSEAFAERGRVAKMLSLDDFYRDANDPLYPRTGEGALDFESPDALHLGEVRECLFAILTGRDYGTPRYDFKTASRLPRPRPLSLPRDGVLIVEGLHALNPEITRGLPPGSLFRLFISVSTNLVDRDGERLISGRKVRFLRRLCRDFEHRGASASRTYELWRGVLAGEDAYLYPYRDTADRQIDTFHRYEIGVFAPLAERLLSAPDAPQGEYLDTVRRAVAAFSPISPALVPPTSLLREFLPTS